MCVHCTAIQLKDSLNEIDVLKKTRKTRNKKYRTLSERVSALAQLLEVQMKEWDEEEKKSLKK